MLNLELLEKRMQSFPTNYMDNFDYIWKWKLQIEREGKSILTNDLKSTHFRSAKILNRWQTYRNGDNKDSIGTLKEALENITEAYNQIKEYTILEFNEMPIEPLHTIWHELGRVKEKDGQKNQWGLYSIIAVCKPLLLLWGQTLAFDSKVRKNIAGVYQIPRYNSRWGFNVWFDGMRNISNALNDSPSCIKALKKLSSIRYGEEIRVPYGRFLDIYYFEGN